MFKRNLIGYYQKFESFQVVKDKNCPPEVEFEFVL